jgi:hypothetical protein
MFDTDNDVFRRHRQCEADIRDHAATLGSLGSVRFVIAFYEERIGRARAGQCTGLQKKQAMGLQAAPDPVSQQLIIWFEHQVTHSDREPAPESKVHPRGRNILQSVMIA